VQHHHIHNHIFIVFRFSGKELVRNLVASYLATVDAATRNRLVSGFGLLDPSGKPVASEDDQNVRLELFNCLHCVYLSSLFYCSFAAYGRRCALQRLICS
jgi:hypothetical protein